MNVRNCLLPEIPDQVIKKLKMQNDVSVSRSTVKNNVVREMYVTLLPEYCREICKFYVTKIRYLERKLVIVLLFDSL